MAQPRSDPALATSASSAEETTDFLPLRDVRKRLGWHLGAISVVVTLVLMTVLLMPFQYPILKLAPRFWWVIPTFWHRQACRLIGVEVVVRGERAHPGPVLFASNHISWLDIPVLGGQLRGAFIAKKEVSGWGVFGLLAKLNATLFIDRRRRSASADQRDALKTRFERHDNLILFPEGTSTDGASVRPFKSALFSVAEIPLDKTGRHVAVQPVTISYTRVNGMPFVRAQRPLVAWFGDMELTSHVWQVLCIGKLTACIQFHDPVSIDRFESRKQLAAACHARVAEGLRQANAGRLGAAGSDRSRA